MTGAEVDEKVTHQNDGVRRVKFNLNERPFIVIWEMTRACELACKHCRASAIAHRDERELTTQEAKALADEIAQWGRPRPVVVFTGGDPLMRPDFLELVKYFHDLNIAPAVAPSVTPRLTPDAIRSIRESGASSISISIDGTSEIHDRFRGVEGSYELTLHAIEISKEVGLRLQLNTSVTKFNVKELPKIAALASELKVVTWSIFLLVPTGRGRYLESLSASEVEDVFHFLVDISNLVPIKVTEAPHYRRVLQMRRSLSRNGLDWKEHLPHGELYYQLSSDFERSFKGVSETELSNYYKATKRPPLIINAGNGFAFISHIGDVYPSGFLPLCAGNVRNTWLTEIYQNSKIFRDLRDLTKLEGKCKACDYLNICGGSRSRAFALSGNYLAEDPSCLYHPLLDGSTDCCN